MLRRDDQGLIPASVSFGLALVGTGVLAFAPLGSRQEAVLSPGGRTTVSEVDSVSLVQTEGASILVLLAVPVAVAAIGLAASLVEGRRAVRSVAAGLLLTLTWLGLMSIGVFYLPSAIAMLVAAVKTTPPYAAPA